MRNVTKNIFLETREKMENFNLKYLLKKGIMTFNNV